MTFFRDLVRVWNLVSEVNDVSWISLLSHGLRKRVFGLLEFDVTPRLFG
jgi:hypothetical protein